MMTAAKDEMFFLEGEPIRGKIDVIKSVLYNTFKTVRQQPTLAWE